MDGGFFFLVFPFFSLIRDANRLDSEWNHGGSESRSDSDCMVPDSNPVLTRNWLNGSDSKKTSILKDPGPVLIIVLVTASNPKCIYLRNYIFFC